MFDQELAAQRQEIESLRSDKVGKIYEGKLRVQQRRIWKIPVAKAGIEEHYQGQLQD